MDKKHSYTVEVTSTYTLDVNADNEEEAMEIACGEAWEYDADSNDAVVLRCDDKVMSQKGEQVFNLIIRLPADVASYDGECNTLSFHYDSDVIPDPEKAAREAVMDFLVSGESISARDYAGSDFNWGDVADSMPDHFYEEHGLFPISGQSVDACVEHDELLNGDVEAQFRSVWDGGSVVIESTCTVELATHRIRNIENVNPEYAEEMAGAVDCLDGEYVTIFGKDYQAVPESEAEEHEGENVFIYEY